MSQHLTEEQLEHFKEAFQLFDVDGGGSIDDDELGALMRFLGHHLSEKEIQGMIKKWDPSSSEAISLEGFLEMLASYSNVVDVEETMVAAFQDHFPSYESPQGILIPPDEFILLMTKNSDASGSASAITAKEVQDFLAEKNLVDEEGDVRVTEFVQELLRI